MTTFDHPNIVKIEESFEDQDKVYFIIQELFGGNLFDMVMMNGKLSEGVTASIAA
jgi:serine/threonine protein kinase